MSESSADKTKRNMLNNLKDYHWKQQISVFPYLSGDDYDQDELFARTIIPDDFNNFKTALRRSFKDVGFLVIIRSLSSSRNTRIKESYPRRHFLQVYITIYSSELLDSKKLKNLINSVYDDECVRHRVQPVTQAKLSRSIKTIAMQKLHNIEKLLLGYPNIKRFTKLNFKNFKKIDSVALCDLPF